MSVSKGELKAAMDQMLNMVDVIYDPVMKTVRQGVVWADVSRQVRLIRHQIHTVSRLAKLDETSTKRSTLVLRRQMLADRNGGYRIEEVHNSLEYQVGDQMSKHVIELMVEDPMWNVVIKG